MIAIKFNKMKNVPAVKNGFVKIVGGTKTFVAQICVKIVKAFTKNNIYLILKCVMHVIIMHVIFMDKFAIIVKKMRNIRISFAKIV